MGHFFVVPDELVPRIFARAMADLGDALTHEGCKGLSQYEDTDYHLLSLQPGRYHVWEAPARQSQLFRRLIASEHNAHDGQSRNFNWREAPAMATMIETVRTLPGV